LIALRFDYVTDDRQAQSRASQGPRSAFVDSIKSLKNPPKSNEEMPMPLSSTKMQMCLSLERWPYPDANDSVF
jgi:hypothetical protein